MGLLDRLRAAFQSDRVNIRDRFEILRSAVSGTMSKFFMARDRKTGDIVGLKLADREKVTAFESRFKGLKKPSEGEIAISLKHPLIVETYEYGVTTSGQDYILMEYVHGPGLGSAINERNPELAPQRLTFIRQMAEAIQAVHDAGFIHRDVCPRNFICHHDFKWLKLIDFGLTVPDKPEFRQPGNRTGTPQYMAPEIVRRRNTDRRVDIFALGVSFYRLLTREHPWGSTDTSGVGALAHDSRPPTDILEHRPHLNPALARIVNRCLAADPGERPDSANSILSAIRAVETEDV